MLNRQRQPETPPADKVVPLTAPPAGLPAADDKRRGFVPSDWSSALELVEEASLAIRISEERAEELEAQLEDVVAQATEELRRLEAELRSSQMQLAASEDRVRFAEARASEAESWLVRLNDAIHVAFSPLQRRAAAGQTQARTYRT